MWNKTLDVPYLFLQYVHFVCCENNGNNKYIKKKI